MFGEGDARIITVRNLGEKIGSAIVERKEISFLKYEEVRKKNYSYSEERIRLFDTER